MQVDEDDAAIESANHERLPQETNAVDNSGFAVWCKNNGLSDQVVQTLLDAGFRTPKDLMDREDDLDDVELSKPDFRQLVKLIDRMRNASASISVDNAALGLATMGKQQHTAARDDAPMDAQRATELDEQIKQAFEAYQLENQQNLSGSQRPNELLRNPIPRINGEVQFLASTAYIGDNEYAQLASNVACMFAGRAQDRKATAVVQSFGCGKTRSALQLVKDYIVLPLEISAKNMLIEALIDTQTSMKNDLMSRNKLLGSEPTVTEIRTLSNRCLRLVHLVLFSLRESFDHAVALNQVDAASEAHRRGFAAMLCRRSGPLVDYATSWFNRCKERILKMTESEFGVAQTAFMTRDDGKLKVVFVFDEVHELFKQCYGFCLPTEASSVMVKQSIDKEKSMVEQWLDGLDLDTTGNNLYYQFRRVMHHYVDTEANRYAFVLCSTKFRAWDELLDLDSPFTRDHIARFHDLHWFTEDDVKSLIQYYFSVPDEVFTPARKKQLTRYRRPLFVTYLLVAFANSMARMVGRDHDREDWFDAALDAADEAVNETANSKVDRLLKSKKLVARGHLAQDLLYMTYCMEKLCGGMLVLPDTTLGEVVDYGIVRLHRFSGSVARTDDPILMDAVERKVRVLLGTKEKKNDPIVDQLLKPLIRNVCGDTTTKGKAGERIIAWLAMRDGLKVKVAAGRQEVTLQPGNLLASRAGDKRQLEQLLGQSGPQEQQNEAQFLWRLMTATDTVACHILFPSDKCHPDVVFRQCNGDAKIVVVQCKKWKCALTPGEFTEALCSLHPLHYYEDNYKDICKEGGQQGGKKNETLKHESPERESWKEHKGATVQDFAFQRVVFSALGFSKTVHFLVQEYNLDQVQQNATRTPRYIHLLSLRDIEQQIGESYATLVTVCQDVYNVDPADVQDTPEFMPQHAWMQLSDEAKLAYTPDKLKEMWTVRRWRPPKAKDAMDKQSTSLAASETKQKKPPSSKTEEEKKRRLISKLDAYNVQQVLTELNWKLP